MLGALTLLLLYQLAGEVIVQFLTLPIPGPVVGMALLFLTLVIRGGVPDDLRGTANKLLQHLSLPIDEAKRFPQLTVLSIAPLLASTIHAVFENGSVTELFDGDA